MKFAAPRAPPRRDWRYRVTVASVDDVEATISRAVAHAHAIVQGATPPYQGAKALWRMEIPLRELADALLMFVGLASEWEDHPKQRQELEREIIVQADRFMARFGK